MANMNSIRLKTKELLRFHSGYRGDLAIIATLLKPIVSGKLNTKYEFDMT